MLKASIQRKEEALENDYQLMGRFFEASCEENDAYNSDRYTSPRRKTDDWKGLYF